MTKTNSMKTLNSSLNRPILETHVVEIDAAGKNIEQQINQFSQAAKKSAKGTDADVVLAMLVVK